MHSPYLSIIVVAYDMQREIHRTLLSLTENYQENVSKDEYEIIVMDNGSPIPLSDITIKSYGTNFQLQTITNAPTSPAYAINYGVSKANSNNVAIMIDGARIASPSIVSKTIECLNSFPRAIVQTIGMHIGPDLQTKSIEQGYDQKEEDRLLDSIGWPESGYKLFSISVFAGSSKYGYFLPICESNFLSCSKDLFFEAKQYNEEYKIPGGGFVNLDFHNRLISLPHTRLYTLLGEATFHQIHGGAITNQPSKITQNILRKYDIEHKLIYGCPYINVKRFPRPYGDIKQFVIHLASFLVTFININLRKLF